MVMDTSGNLYGTTVQDSAYGAGTVFKPTSSAGGCTPNQARTEAFCWSIEKAHIGAYRLEASGTFYGTPARHSSSRARYQTGR